MEISRVKIAEAIGIIGRYMVRTYQKEHKCSEDKAIIAVVNTKTYEMLQDRSTGLFSKTPEYVMHLMNLELQKTKD